MQMHNVTITSFNQKTPVLGNAVFLASGVVVVGDVILENEVNVWFNSVIRGDVNSIRVGQRTNIQDNSTIHVTSKTGPTVIGTDVTIGHNCVIHACTIGDRSLIGMGSIVLDGVVVEPMCFVAAGSVLTPGKLFPSGSMIMGSPGKVVRGLSDNEKEFLLRSAIDYAANAKSYMI